MVPALIAAECVLTCKICSLDSPASGPNAPHSTARRIVRLVSDDLAFNEKALRRGGPLCPPARFDLLMADA